MKTNLSCETSLRVCKLKMWMRSFRARLPSESASWRCENLKLSCETSHKIWTLNMWKWSFRARIPSKSERWRCENEAFVQDFLQSLQAEDEKTKLSCETPSKSESWRCESEAFVRDIPENLNVEDVRTVLSCKMSLRVCWRCENEAFVRDFPQSLQSEGVKAKLSCMTSLKISLLKMWKRSFHARLPSGSASWRCEDEPFVRDFPQSLQAEDVKTDLSCETSFKVWKLKMWKRSFHARHPSKSESWRCENGAFVRDVPQSLKAEDVRTKLSCGSSVAQSLKAKDVKTKLSCETSLKVCKLKMWKQSFRARHHSKSASWRWEKWSFCASFPSKSASWRCENETFVQDFLQSLKAEDVKAKLSCETALKIWTLKMWKRSFRARHPSKSESWRCENETFVRDFPQSLQAENVKTILSCETSLNVCKLKMWKRTFRADVL